MQKRLVPKTLTFIAASLLLILLGAAMPTKSSSSNVILVPRDYATIQQAIDRANPGDTIEIASGTYNEKLKITKSIRLVGQGINQTVVSDSGTVVTVDADNVEIRGLSVRDGTYGIFLWYCQNALLRDNEMSGNRWNFGVWGSSVSEFIHDIDSSNKVDGKTLYYWTNRRGGQVPKDAGYVALVNSTEILMKDAMLTSNEQGVLLVSTTNSIVENVTAYGNDVGIDSRWSSNNTIRKSRFASTVLHAVYFEDSHDNAFYENTMLNNILGLELVSCNRNAFYHNNFIENTDQVWQAQTQQTSWQNEDAHAGNYWSDYTGPDANGDGIGDTPYGIDSSNQDNYPLINIYAQEPPRAHAGEDKTVVKNSAEIFDASESFDDVGINQYSWDFGDGTTENGREVSHAYAEVGEYVVTLTVVDLAGKSSSSTLRVTVVEPPLALTWWIVVIGIAAGGILFASLFFWKSRSTKKKK